MRIKNLDILRGVAILLVLGEHKHVADLWMQVGWTGVDLFFVLSGFLVSGLLFSEYKRHGALRVSRFLLRRGLKIYPGYYLLLAYYFARNLLRGEAITQQMATQLVFLQNYGPGPVDYTWSLAVEEHFYIFLPLLLLLLQRRRAPSAAFAPIPAITLAACVLAISGRIATHLLLPYDNRTHHFPTHLRADGLLFGVLIGYLYHFHQGALFAFRERRRALLLVASCLFLLPAALLDRTSFWMHTLGLTSLYLGYGGLLVSVLPDPRPAPEKPQAPSAMGRASSALGAAVAFIGYYSYAIYLWHAPVASGGMKLVQRILGPLHPTVEFILYVVASVFMGVLMTRLVEAPVLALRDRIWPTRGEALGPQIAPKA